MPSLRRAFLRFVQPISEWVGKAHMPYTHKRIKAHHYREITNILKPGHVLITRIEGELTNIFIPGFFTHGAIYGGNRVVIEAIGKGVVATDLIDFLLSKDYVIILRPKFCGLLGTQRVADYCHRKIGTPYDYLFEHGDKSFYCFELVWIAYASVFGNYFPFKKRSRLGLDTIIGDDFLKAIDKWEVIYDSRL